MSHPTNKEHRGERESRKILQEISLELDPDAKATESYTRKRALPSHPITASTLSKSIYLYTVEGKEIAEIAKVLGVSKPLLEKAIVAEGYTPEDKGSHKKEMVEEAMESTKDKLVSSISKEISSDFEDTRNGIRKISKMAQATTESLFKEFAEAKQAGKRMEVIYKSSSAADKMMSVFDKAQKILVNGDLILNQDSGASDALTALTIELANDDLARDYSNHVNDPNGEKILTMEEFEEERRKALDMRSEDEDEDGE